MLTSSLLFGVAVPAWAGWDEGWEAYKRQDLATAINEFWPLAQEGDYRARLVLREVYFYTREAPFLWIEGVEAGPINLGAGNLGDFLSKWVFEANQSEFDKAEDWFRNAAAQGDIKAEFYLGITMFEPSKRDQRSLDGNTDQTTKDTKDFEDRLKELKALAERESERSAKGEKLIEDAANREDVSAQLFMSWARVPYIASWDEMKGAFDKAANQGSAAAQIFLCDRLKSKKPQEALRWCLKAADQGFGLAYHLLSEIYYADQIGPDYKLQAYKWCYLADTTPGHPPPRFKACGIPSTELTPAEISKAEKLAQEWRSKMGQRVRPALDR